MNEKDIEYYTEEEAFWREVLEQAEGIIENLRRSLKLQNAIAEMAQLNIDHCKEEVKDGRNTESNS